MNGSLRRLAAGLSLFPDEPRLVQRKQALEAQLKAIEAARQKEQRIVECESSAQKLQSAGDLQGSLARVQRGLSEFPDESRLLRMKSVLEKSIADVLEKEHSKEEQQKQEEKRKRQEEERKRQEEEQQRLKAERAAREGEKRRQEQEAEKLRLEQEKQRKEEERQRVIAAKAARDAEKRKRKEEAEQARLEQARKRQEAAQKQLARRPDQAPATQPAALAAKPARTGMWLSVAGGLVLAIALGTLGILGRHGTLVIMNAAPGTIIRVENATYTVGQDGTLKISLKPGSHGVELAKSGYQSRDLQVDIARGKELPLGDTTLQPVPVSSENLIPTPGRPNGTLIIETGNKDVSIYVDNVKQNTGRRGALRISIPPVEHEIRVERPGYVTRTVREEVTSNTEKKLDLRLERETVTPQHARLLIQTAAPGSQVVVDGQNKGTVAQNGAFSADVSEGDHEIALITNSRKSDVIQRHFAQAGQVQLSGADFKTAPLPENAEDTAWAQARDSQNIGALESFQQRFPSSAHRGDIEPRLDDLYWTKANESSALADFRDYLTRYPKGKHSQDAQNQVSKLELQQIQNTGDARALEDFLKKYPSGTIHDQAASKLDDMMWQRAGKANDAGSLREYLSRFPSGKHAEQAHSALDQLAVSKPPARVQALDEKGAVLAVLQQYKKSYEDQSVDELRTIWPAMGPRQISNVGVFFKSARSVTLAYNLVGEPEISDTASTLTFTQSLSFVINGKQQKNSAQVIMQLKKVSSGSWLIESIR